MAAPTCSHCDAADVIGPFEMDGISDGTYHRAGLWWIVCRACNRSTLVRDDSGWEPEYDSWRHGGWYVTNIRYPSGACGCVSRNFADRKWRIVCDSRPGSFPGGPNDHTYASRDAAARAERALSLDLVTS